MRCEPILQVGDVMCAQRDIVGEIENARRDLRFVSVDAPTASELGAFELNVLAERFHLGEKGADFFQVASGFWSHGAPLRMSESSTGVTHFSAGPVFDARM